jgi:PII-like signaling protein
MKGYQISFITEQNRRIEGTPTTEWLMNAAKELGVGGAMSFVGVDSVGNDGRRHSARFFELLDQPVEIMMAATEAQAVALFEKVNATKTRLFYIKAAVEYGELGTQAVPSSY